MIRRFISYYRPYKATFFADLLAALVLAVCDLVYPQFTRAIINDLIPDQNWRMILVYAAILLGIYLIKTAMNYFVNYIGHLVGVGMQADMRRDLFAHMEKLPCSFYDNHKTGALMSRMTNDLFDVSELAHHGPEDLFISAILFIGSGVLMLRIDPFLTLLVFLLLPPMILFMIRQRRKMREAFLKSREEIAEINAGLENSIAGIRVSKAYTSENHEKEKFAKANGRFVDSRRGAYRAMGEFSAGMGLLIDLITLAVLAGGGLCVIFRGMDYGDLVAFILYANVFLQPVRRIVGFVEQYQNGMTGFARFTEIMDEEPEYDAPDARPIGRVSGNLSFRDVSFSYEEGTDGENGDDGHRRKTVLSHISFDIPAGKTVALVGSSGGGKTTVCHLIPRFYPLAENAGTITLDGVDTRKITLTSLRENIGMVSQDVFLFNATVYENIAYGVPTATEADVFSAAKRANIHKEIIAMPNGYQTVVGERGVKLSGGQKQRVAIARAFLKNPPLLILDEATSALDNATERMIQKSLDELSVGRTTLVVAHRLSTVRRADEILFLDEKGIRERGTHEELLRQNGAYASLVRAMEESTDTNTAKEATTDTVNPDTH